MFIAIPGFICVCFWNLRPYDGFGEKRPGGASDMLIGLCLDEEGDGQSAIQDQFRKLGCDRIFRIVRRRRGIDSIMEYLRQGDTLALPDLTLLGSSFDELIFGAERLHKQGVSVSAIREGLLPGTAIGEAFGPICAILAHARRQYENQDSKKPDVFVRGRPRALTPEEHARVERLLQRKSVAEVARILNVSPATIYRNFPRRNGKRARIQKEL